MLNNTAVVKPLNLFHVSKNNTVQHLKQIGLLAIPMMSEKRILNMEDIYYMRSDSNYTTIYLQTEKLVVSKTLKWFEPKMNNYFFRPHKSFLINIKAIATYKLEVHQLILHNGTKIPVARSHRKALMKILT